MMEERLNMVKRTKIAGILKAMTPNLRLRNVLKIIADLTLARLMGFLQAHFEEGNTPDVCEHQCLSSLKKLPISLLFVVRK